MTGIDEAAGRMKGKHGSKREIRALPGLLWPGERVLELAGGLVGKNRMGLIALTDRRILLTFEGMIGKSSEDFPLDRVTSIDWESGVFFGKIKILASGNASVIDKVEKTDGARLVERARTAKLDSGTPTAASVTPDVATALRQVKELHEAGVLTEEEFAAKKAELLARM